MALFKSLGFKHIKNIRHYVYSHCQKRFYSYEDDGKTKALFLSKEIDDNILIDGYSKMGFRLTNGLFVVGPVILFPKTILSWNVADDSDISDDSLCLFYKLEPPVDTLIIGLSDNNSFKNRKYLLDKFKMIDRGRLNFELLPVEKAVSTFNFLSYENRFVAAALIPPLKIDYIDSQFSDLLYGDVNPAGRDDYLIGDDEEESLEEDRKMNKLYEHSKGVRRPISKIVKNLINKKRDKEKPNE